MSRSIQSRLTLSLTATAIALSAATGFLLYHFIGSEMIHNFDRGLQSNGRAIVSLVSYESGAVVDFEFNEAVMPQYRPGPRAEYFQIQFADGKAYAQSKSLGSASLPVVKSGTREGESFYDVELPSGRLGRAIRIAFVPQSDPPQATSARPMVAVVARSRGELDEALQQLLLSLVGVGSLLAAATALTSMWIVRRSLRPLRRLADQAAAIDDAHLSARLSEQPMPGELAPIYERLNDLLGRLEAAFARERRFTSDVAHELRTPIAELRSIAEVALAWPDDSEATHGALCETLAIAVQMQTLVGTLLALAKTNQGRLQIVSQPVRLSTLVEQVVEKLPETLEARPLEISISDSATVLADPTLLRSVVTNLLANAVEYASGDGSVRCLTLLIDGQLNLCIENQVDDLSPDDLTRMFDSFWRKTASRTDNSHAGLGLSLVRAYCGLMGIEVVATMPVVNTLRMCISFPTSSSTPSCEPAQQPRVIAPASR